MGSIRFDSNSRIIVLHYIYICSSLQMFIKVIFTVSEIVLFCTVTIQYKIKVVLFLSEFQQTIFDRSEIVVKTL